MIGTTLLIIGALILLIYVTVELKRLKHKLWAIFLIALILFGYFSFNVTLKEQNIDYSSFDGIMEATGIYFSWLGGIFGNVKTITGSAVEMDWSQENSPVNSSRR